jgi:hypothetical protein
MALHLPTCGFTLGSSSPLRGVATTGRSRRRGDGGWSSSPLRGVATAARPAPPGERPPSSSPLRGVATIRYIFGRVPAGVLIAPTRGRNAARGLCSPIPECRSSSPLRGVATGGGRGRRRERTARPHLGGSQHPELVPREVVVVSCPHRPYEGSDGLRVEAA